MHCMNINPIVLVKNKYLLKLKLVVAKAVLLL